MGNECGETSSEKGVEFSKTVNEWVRSVDTDHPTAIGENKYKLGWANEANMDAVMDNLGVAGFNYAENQYDGFHEKHPDWAILGTETASAFQSRGIYSAPWINGVHVVDNEDGNQAPDPARGQISSYDNRSARYGKTATDAWIYDRDRKYVAGQFIWTGFDYIGEPLPHYGTSKSSYFGAVDTCGIPKDVYYLYQSIWTDVEENPMVHILPHWNWEDDKLREYVTYPDRSTLGYLDDGEIVDYSDEDVGKIPLRVYSNAPSVELFKDGVSLGRKDFAQMMTEYGYEYQQQSESSDRLYLEWAVEWEYKVGTVIEAVAYDKDGNVIARDKVVTAGNPSKLSLSAEKSEINADGEDLSYIVVDILDENGNIVPTASNTVSFSIEGEGVIVGVDNGDAVSRERYKAQADGSWKRSAYSGKCIVIVQSTKEAGSFTVTATSNGLSSSSVTVNTK